MNKKFILYYRNTEKEDIALLDQEEIAENLLSHQLHISELKGLDLATTMSIADEDNMQILIITRVR